MPSTEWYKWQQAMRGELLKLDDINSWNFIEFNFKPISMIKY